MYNLIQHHGFDALFVYYLVISVLGTLPPLPDNATYWQKWGYGIAHAICGNAKNVMATIGQKTTEDKS